ncbi:transcription-repair coupling factor [Aliidiomarina iranensis]|uniref:Transcription-repair-coupling factor n=1 Tax=Aliidiomarina iranensis TaxID=1434071 RepID=A0A432W111_9GAMM|nr:transcription-repair coupling factor [Aliidiomarina iranensis]RUO22581.1 transcription-repair coupling factor [Aliidiomarina iranensis]
MSQISLLQPPFPEQAGKEFTWRHLSGSSTALAVSQLLEQQPRQLLLVTIDTPSAYRFAQELKFYSPQYAQDIQVLPDWETLPYDNFSPHQDIVSERIRVLAKLPQQQQGILIVALNTLMHKLPPASFIAGHSLLLKAGEKHSLESLRMQLERAGYRHVNQVMEHGEYSVRGSIVDLFPMGTEAPYRIDYFDDDIDSIRQFDVDSQRSDAPIAEIALLPAREFPTTPDGIELFRRQFREQFEALTAKDSVYQQVSQGIMPAGIEYYAPLFFTETSTLFDYLPSDTLLLTHGDLQGQLRKLWHDLTFRYEDRRWDKQKPILPPLQLFMAEDQIFQAFKQYPRIRLGVIEGQRSPGPIDFKTRPVSDITIDGKQKEPLAKVQAHLEKASAKGERVLFCVESAGRRESMLQLLGKGNIHPEEIESFAAFIQGNHELGILISPLEHSFFAEISDTISLWLITETELLGHRPPQHKHHDKRSAQQADALIKNLAELSIGQLVVHIDHGIGRYQGLTSLDAGGIETEFLTLEYDNNTKLFVPVSSLHLISRYSGGDQERVKLSKLGNDSWEKARKRAAEKVRDVAAELLEVYAQREAKPGYAFSISEEDHARFAAGFPFNETDDQIQAITAVLEDMRKPRAMDRLVCGDVGFGKTEVAMRAAFTAVNDGKQVAVLVPTTLLAQQHYDNFRDRFAEWPVSIELLSRFRTGKQTTKALSDLESGKVDIVIGTHKLLQPDIKFQDLGLLVVDEEHRFGVRQKEQIKRLRSDVDILTLTATPIPRTLNMAMNNIRDLSIIATPPARRLAVKTFVREYDKATVREALLREILRGGQVYFLHNNVETIERTAEKLRELVPEARIQTAHGQMGERELEAIMSDFYHQRFNVLVCTTIIETGIDVPSANTIIMDRADNLGLAQLHQLRGRVGRSHHQAYAYLLTPNPRRMTKDAVKRLEAISQLEDLGAGFVLATHDLEIRGAGELLGDDQSGQIESIGFSLYMDMLDEAVQALRDGKEPSLDQLLKHRTEVDLRIPALLPNDYIGDVNTRLSMYKRIAGAESERELDELQIELIDRFGLLPDAAKNLFRISQIRLMADPLGVRKIEVGPQGGHIDFADRTSVQPETIISMLQREPQRFGMEGSQRLKIREAVVDTQERIKLVQSILMTLADR